MMLSDEPYRWAEGVANRRDYIEDQIRAGSPVVGVGYEDGILLLTLSRSQQKLFEVYDRIGLGAVGHSTDIEKLRQAAIDMAHSIGFNYSEEDVTLRQIVYFGLGPAIKAGFDDVVRSPFLARVMLAELDGEASAHTFYIVDYDGAFFRYEDFCTLGGIPDADHLMEQRLDVDDVTKLSLTDALSKALQAWAIGRWVGKLEEIPSEDSDLDALAVDVDLNDILKRELQDLDVEAVVLQRSLSGKPKYRLLTDDELAPVLDSFKK
ncbi:MAG: proteasome alpha subunit [Candidatus Latescibacterota bacterium]|jgi:proteasome alpha subunit